MSRSKITCLRPPLAPATSSGWKPDQVRGNRHQRGYGREWEITRERIKLRDEGLCQPCLRQGRVTVGTECDHITPKAQGGQGNDENLQWICVECHRTKTASESRGGGSE